MKEDEEEIMTSKNSILRTSTNTMGDEEMVTDKETLLTIKVDLDYKKCSEIVNQRLDEDKYIYEISLEATVSTDKKYNWIVYRTLDDMKKSFKKFIKLIKKEQNINEIEKENLLNHLEKALTDFKSVQEAKLGIFINPNKIQGRVSIEDINKVKSALKNCIPLLYLRNYSNGETERFIKEFLNISNISFKATNKIKPFEGFITKQVDPKCCRRCFSCVCPCLDSLFFAGWNKRWFILKEELIDYSNSSEILKEKNAYFFDSTFEIIEKEGSKKDVTLASGMRNLVLKFDSEFEKLIWIKEIKERLEKNKKALENNIYQAYTGSKILNVCKWFSDGQNYFEDLYSSLMAATETVFITDWWLSPEVWLKRPVDFKYYEKIGTNNPIDLHKEQHQPMPQLSRVKDILYYLAEKGVKIYIMVYQEKEIALTLNSAHTKQSLLLHENIQVIRHPKDISVVLWSHHEKLVIIDQKIGYVGGLDLCWGRYDTNEHPLIEVPTEDKKYLFPGIDYSNARICDFINVENYLTESVDRSTTVRMPWHDVHIKLQGPVVPDIARHFIQRWNDAKFEKREGALTEVKTNANYGGDIKDQKVKKEINEKSWLGGIISKVMKSKSKSSENKADFEDEEVLLNEENNQNLRGIFKRNQPEEKQKTMEEIIKEENTKYEIDTKYIDWEMSEEEKKNYFKLIQREKQEEKNETYYKKMLKGITQKSLNKQKENQTADYIEDYQFNGEPIKGIKATCQVLRSASNWSAGLSKKECSILNGYYHLIDNSKHYIYIENQFFVSRSWKKEEAENLSNVSDAVVNEIAYHIRKRLEKAILNKENYKVFIFIPLLPGFAGEPESSGTLQLIMKHTYCGLSNNKGLSIIENLRKLVPGETIEEKDKEIKKYINVFSLRNHGILNNIPVTEIIYIHSKLMIVDDEYVLIGSANINDRSMLGSRDSEFAVIVQEDPKKTSIINGKKTKVARFASDFRKALMAEHLGIDKNDLVLVDPCNPELNDLMCGRAKNNTVLYRKIFHCYPDDEYPTFSALNERKIYKTEDDFKELRELYENDKDKIKGHIVEFPLNFLGMEIDNLGLKTISAENLLPERNYI